MAFCEVRVTTYKRPELLRRSLNSLIDQTSPDWQALVFDDSPEQEAKVVVDELNDSRIIYKPNSTNLGCSGNLNHAFQSSNIIGGKYACILEDDNYFYPDFISENIRSIEEHKVNIVLRNQDIRLEKEGVSVITKKTSRGEYFCQGIWSPLEVYARLFFCEGISNGGLFWRTDTIKSNFQVDPSISDSWHQEIFRTLQIKEPILFESTPLCAWTQLDSDSNSTRKKPWFSSLYSGPPIYNRATQAALIHLHKKYGNSLIHKASAVTRNREEFLIILENQLLNIFHVDYDFIHLSKIKRSTLLVKNYLRYLTSGNVFQDFFARESLL
jgi:glycosyltransferase involved in cell wall biosynthesis